MHGLEFIRPVYSLVLLVAIIQIVMVWEQFLLHEVIVQLITLCTKENWLHKLYKFLWKYFMPHLYPSNIFKHQQNFWPAHKWFLRIDVVCSTTMCVCVCLFACVSVGVCVRVFVFLHPRLLIRPLLVYCFASQPHVQQKQRLAGGDHWLFVMLVCNANCVYIR